nr:MAG TPA: Protein of unknown function (DUF3624) [Bacteriophage sp.]
MPTQKYVRRSPAFADKLGRCKYKKVFWNFVGKYRKRE